MLSLYQSNVNTSEMVIMIAFSQKRSWKTKLSIVFDFISLLSLNRLSSFNKLNNSPNSSNVSVQRQRTHFRSCYLCCWHIEILRFNWQITLADGNIVDEKCFLLFFSLHLFLWINIMNSYVNFRFENRDKMEKNRFKYRLCYNELVICQKDEYRFEFDCAIEIHMGMISNLNEVFLFFSNRLHD